MKKEIIVILIIVFFISCDKRKSVYDSVNPKDSVCIKELEDAEKDLRNNKLVYCNYTGNIGFHALRAEKQMDSLLKIKNIEFQNESSPCVVDEKLNYHCYCELMQEKINEKFGSKFIDSLLFKADSIYILKHLDEVFYNGSLIGSWDKPALFPGDKYYDEHNHSGLQKEFDSKVEYEKDYRYLNGENSLAFLQVYLDIDRNGNAKIYDYHIDFFDYSKKESGFNKKYWEYFKSIAFPLIENTKWTPAKIKNINVNSRNDIAIYLK
ncbi:hypothetical protein OX283_014215 [Flavobacterium sp. SUN052]|uniref:hypothetical protein n=1 Tax=Flavobacterium sp. SUN052 TaxID=3002441 RepID=UPI00237DB94B|nr:hypothetical protein [Flavobacterium sp. SUN052]MEC4005822.1 hypothetical protein [Flavobacterium sp. SUN052]